MNVSGSTKNVLITGCSSGIGHETALHLTGKGGEGDPYAEFNAHVAKATAGVYDDGPLAKLGGGPDTVARKIETALTARRPKPRYKVTASARLAIAQRRLVSDRVWDAMMRTQFPTPGK